jgi:hypothetical protein
MTGIVATELTERPSTRTLLETWGRNERMRHVPPVEWMIDKLDRDLRRRVNILLASAANDAMDTELKALCRAIDRLADSAKHSRANHNNSDFTARIDAAVSSLRSLDANLLGRRYPFQSFERSKAEQIWSAMLVVIDHVHRLTEIVRGLDRNVDERLLA